MNSSINNKQNIREYLLGRVANESLLSELEELLFLDADFFEAVELEQEELVHDYVFGRLSETDKNDFEKTLSTNTQRKQEVELAYGLKEKAKYAIPAEPVRKTGFLESIKASFKRPAHGGGVAVLQPAYLGSFAVLLIAIAALAYVFLPRQSSGDLAELRSFYKDERQTEARISGFDYAPWPLVRSAGKREDDNLKLREIELKLNRAAQVDPSAKTFHDLGIFYLNDQNFSGAIKSFEQAIQAGPDSADLRNDLGNAYFELAKSGSKEKKFENLTKSLEEFSKALQLDPNKLEALFNRSLVLQQQEPVLTERAKQSWKEYLQKDPSSKWADEARKNLENLDRGQGSLKTKEQVMDDFLAAYRKKDDETAWKINCQTRDMLSGIWLPDQLSRRYIKAKRDPGTGDERESIDALSYIGRLEKERKADFFISDLALILARAETSDTEKLRGAQESFDEGLVLIKKADNRGALRSFEKSTQLFAEAGNDPGEMMAKYWMMQAMYYLGLLSRGAALGEQILAYSRPKNYKWLETLVHYFAGNIFLGQNEIARAMDANVKALAGAINAGDILLEQRCRATLIEKYLQTGEVQKALQNRFPATELYYNDPVSKWRYALFNGKVLLKLKLNRAAMEYASESLALARLTGMSQNISSSLLLLEEAKTANNELDDALSFASESLAIEEAKPDDTDKYGKKGGVVLRIANLKRDLGRYEESLNDYGQAISLFEKVPEFQLDKYAAHRGRLMCLRSLNRAAEVTTELGTVVTLADGYRRKIVDDESRQSFFDDEQAVYDIAIEDSLTRGDTTEAFQRAEMSKARSLLDIIGQKNSIERLEKSIYNGAEPLSADEIRAKMPANSQIVEYALLEDRLSAWIISKDGPLQTVDLKIDAGNLNSNIAELARLDRNRNSPQSRRSQIAAELFRELIDPLSTFLDPSRTLIIIPDKSLYYVPFASLVTGENKFMIEQFTISYSPSATIFISNSEKGVTGGDRKAERLLSIGDPDFDPEEFPGLRKLVSAKIEADEIGAMMSNSRVITRKDATKEAFMRTIQDAQIVHFAGHYVANPDTPSRSKLVFAGSGGEGEGGLRVSEIAEKKMPGLRLVVLSACETGIENVLRGEGLISASRAFLAAGAPVVVASQWLVDSEATAQLMVAFHRNRQQGLNSAAALQSAQMEMIRDPAGPFASPYYWAAFGVTGGLEK